jgi:hypothetical protein
VIFQWPALSPKYSTSKDFHDRTISSNGHIRAQHIIDLDAVVVQWVRNRVGVERHVVAKLESHVGQFDVRMLSAG